jgi:hypothetical protein
MISPAGKKRGQIKGLTSGDVFGYFPELFALFELKVLQNTYDVFNYFTVAGKNVCVLHIPSGSTAVTVFQVIADYLEAMLHIFRHILFKYHGFAFFYCDVIIPPFFTGDVQEQKKKE